MEKKELVNKVYSILNSIQHSRFVNIDEIISRLCVQNGVFKAHLVEGEGDIVCDNYLIGSISVIDDKESIECDIQLYYIIDNLGQYYITQVELLEIID